MQYAIEAANKSRDGYIAFKKTIGSRTIVLRIGPNGYGGYTASIQLRQGTSSYPEAGGEIKDMTAEAGCELYAWLNCPEACNTMQKALLSRTDRRLPSAPCSVSWTDRRSASRRPEKSKNPYWRSHNEDSAHR